MTKVVLVNMVGKVVMLMLRMLVSVQGESDAMTTSGPSLVG